MWSLVGRTSHTACGESIAGRRSWLRLHNPKHSPMNPRHQALSAPRANMKRLPKQNERGSGAVGKMNAEPGGTVLPHAFDESTPGDKTWLRLHNPKHNPMNPRCQAFSAPPANMNQLNRQKRTGIRSGGKNERGAWWGGPPTRSSTSQRRAT